jgi:hypothetical protein
MAQQNQNDGWNVVSTAPIPKPAQGDGWNVVSTAPIAKPAVDMSNVAGAGGPLPTPSTRVAPPVALQGPPANAGAGLWKSAYDASPLPIAKQIITHPIDSANTIAGALLPLPEEDWNANPIVKTVQGQVDNTVGNLKKAYQDAGNLDFMKSPIDTLTSPSGVAVRRDLGSAVPFVGPVLAQAQEQHDAGNDAGMAGTLTGTVLGAVLPDAVGEAASKLRNVPSRLKSAVQGPITEPIVEGGPTPLERYQSAKNLGVNLDKADATNYVPIQMTKAVNENSIFSGNSYKKLHDANVSALGKANDSFLDNIYAGNSETGGKRVQDSLINYKDALKANADFNYQDLDNQLGDRPLNVRPLSNAAQGILDQYKDYYDTIPKAKPTDTLGLIKNIADMGKTPTIDGPLFNGKAPITSKTPLKMAIDPLTGRRTSMFVPPKSVPAPPVEFPFSKVQQLRSDLIGWNEPNANLVSDLPGSWTKQLSGIADDVMTNSEAGLNPSQIATLREANENWGELKNKFDNPKSPFYNAIRTDSPSTLYDGVGNQKTPEIAKDMRRTLGPAIDAVQRGTIEGAQRATGEGLPDFKQNTNFKTFGGNYNKLDPEYRKALFTPEQEATAQDIGRTGRVLYQDVNPAGTAKLGMKMGESVGPLMEGAAAFAAGHPLAAAALVGTQYGIYGPAQYGLSKFMTHTPSTDWLMKPAAPLKSSIKINPLLPPVSAAIAASQQKKK